MSGGTVFTINPEDCETIQFNTFETHYIISSHFYDMIYYTMASRREKLRLLNAQNELDGWWGSHMDKHTRPAEGVFIFIDAEHKAIYETEYSQKIEELIQKYHLPPNMLIRSTFDNYEIQLPNMEIPEHRPPEEPEIGITIDEVEIDRVELEVEDLTHQPSEETKESDSEPILHNVFNSRIDELRQEIEKLERQLFKCHSEMAELCHIH